MLSLEVLYEKNYQSKYDASNSEINTFFEDFCFGHKHPKRRNNEKEKRKSEKYVQEKQGLFGGCLVHLSHFVQNHWQFFCGVFGTKALC